VGNPLLYYATLLSWGAFLAMLTYLFMNAQSAGEVLKVEERQLQLGTPVQRALLRVARMLAPLRSGVENTVRGQEIDRQLRKAGRPLGMNVAEYLCMSYAGAVLGGTFAYLASLAVWNQPSYPLFFLMVGLGFVYPKQNLKSTIASRQQRMFRDLPYVLDMLTLSTEAGQDFSSAMATVIEKGTPGPLLEEFKIVHQEVTLGKTRAEGLRAMAQRIDLPEVTSFVLALIQAEQLGTSIGKVLRIMADQMRVKRSTIAEELAGKVPVKMMAPLVSLVIPAAFIVLLFGPIYMYMTGQQLE
jgi:tight adherence protein C